MSFTEVQIPESSTATTIHLSPSKPRLSGYQVSHRTNHTLKELTAWCYRAEATAPCLVCDVLRMDLQSDDNFEDVHWLGNVPCRNVKLVGMVVGIQIYETRILYTVDDGTGVIDCAHRQQIPLSSARQDNTNTKYKAPEKLPPPSPLEPVAAVGQLIQVIGSVYSFYNSINIKVQSLVVCLSPNDELHHAKVVRDLHRNLYSKADPFVIPTSSDQPLASLPASVSTQPTTAPHVPSSPPSYTSSSPVKDTFSSPIKPIAERKPVKLRHPSRLHTRDLTANTFRIYLKHYIDCTQEPQRYADNSDASASSAVLQLPDSPTKKSYNGETPRPLRQLNEDATPRSRIPPPIFERTGVKSICFDPPPPSSQAPKPARKGFTLSYLRRVPELSLLASRVTEAVGRRHARAERKRLQEAGLLKRGTPLAPSTSNDSGQHGKRMKRLFEHAIIQLLNEGNITLWDGPIYRCPDTSLSNLSRLWKSNTSVSTVGADSTVFGSTFNATPSSLDDTDDEDALSDPDPSEEAYISLTPEYFCEYVEKAIKVLVEHYERIGKPYAGATRDGILQVLRKDDRWRRVGTWTIDDALDFLKTEGRVWDMGKGRWDLTE